MDLWTQGGEKVGRIARVALTYMHYHMWNSWLVWSCCIAQGAQPGALWWSGSVGLRSGVGEGDVCISSVQFSSSVVSNSLRPHESQHTRPPCPSPTPRVHSNSCPSSQRCHPAISSSVIPFSSFPQSLPASESFPIGQLFAWDGQSIGVSALTSVLPMNTQDWSPLEWTSWSWFMLYRRN